MRSIPQPTQTGGGEQKGYPLSFAQERLWFLDQLAPGNTSYNLPLAIRLQIPVNVHVLERALIECIRRHEILRTKFIVVKGDPKQVIEATVRLNLQVIDLRYLDAKSRDSEATRLATEEATRPFDLTRAPPLRAILLRLGVRDHIFLLSLHHIAADDWSLGLLWKELAAVYAAFVTNKPSPLPRLRIQYLDYAIWQRKWLQGEVLEKQLFYWKRQLANLPVLQLHTDYPRPPVATFRGAFETVTIPRVLSDQVRRFSQSEGCTLFITMLAAFQTLLARYTGQTDIAVGCPIANRNRVEVETLIGFFVNTLVMRTDLSGNPTFRKLLVRVREMAVQAYTHQDLPFEKLVKELQPERHLNRNPLVQITFQLQQRPEAERKAGVLSAEPFEINRGAAIFDFAFRLWDVPNGFSGGIEYSTDLFDASTIRRIASCYQTLLEAAVTNPEVRLSELPIMSEAERRVVLTGENRIRPGYNHSVCVHQLVEAQARRTPKATAVTSERESLTYEQLDQRANQLACRLQALGVGPNVLTAVCMERSVELVIAILSIFKAGGAYVPLDPSYPADRLAFMIQDSGAPVLVTQSHLARSLPRKKTIVLKLDETEWLKRQKKVPLRSAPSPLNLAYVIYTSGSTGFPKGVAISHGALVNHMLWMQQMLPFEESDAVLQKTNISFDASIWEFWAPLISGARLVMARPERLIDSASLIEQVLQHRITVLQLVPSVLNLCLSEPRFPECQTLRRVFAGGEALTTDLVVRFHETGIRATLYNLYGPSETTIDATWWTCDRESARYGITIGRPISGMAAYVLDVNLQAVPRGVPGELFLSGAGLGRGYLNAPELTAERFVPHPFSSENGVRLYKTGDIVVLRANGEIEYLGRVDTQVKLRGMRIELGEIESLLRDHPDIEQAFVVLREDAPGDQRLVGYIVSRRRTPDNKELRRFLSGRLPEYAIPSVWITLDRIPLTPNGKVDRSALPKPEQDSMNLPGAYAEPRTPTEEKLVATWKAVLKSSKVGINDNFFELGGHSLLAIQLVARLREEFRIDLPLRALFHSATPAELAEVIERIILEEVERMPETETTLPVEGGG